MLEFRSHFSNWEKSEKIVIARVIKTWGSSPRPVGSCLIIDEDLNMIGSVSGGCVEGAVLKEAKALLERGGSKVLNYGVTDDDAWSVGLSCGGKITVFLQVLMKSELRESIFVNISENSSFIWLTKVEDSLTVKQQLSIKYGKRLGSEFPQVLQEQAGQALEERRSKTIEHHDEIYFAHIFPRRSQMLIIGAAHISADLIHLAKYYGFETVVIDPRGAFADKTSFVDPPDQIVQAYPSEVLENYKLDAYSYAVILSHDPKIDDNALHILLKSEVAYIGALGSKKTHAKRVGRLSEAGFSDGEIARIAAPIGVNINAKSPREIALSIMGQIVQVKNEFR